MRYLSVCSGIEAATVAWHQLGWEAAAFSEIEAFPRAVLKHRYPDTPLHGDFTTIEGDEYGPIDLLVGGTPCQSFSVAGLRGGMDDERGQLALQFLRLLDRTRARWVVWENVPGVLSSNGGRDFGSFLGGLVELGYGFAYRVLDAQFFGVPQRRRRVFVVGHLGDWRRAAAVLFERHSLSGHSAPRREKGQRIANAITERPDRGGGNGEGQRLIAPDVANCLQTTCDDYSRADGFNMVAHSLRAEGFDASEDGTGRGTPLVPVAFQNTGQGWWNESEVAGTVRTPCGGDSTKANLIAFTAKDHGADASDISPTLRSGAHSGSHANGGVMPAVAFQTSGYGAGVDEIASTMQASYDRLSNQVYGCIEPSSAVRRLTPVECERLQGFPDDFTLVPYRGKPAADGPRYKALGNSMAVPVMRWIGERISAVDAIQTADIAA